MWGSAGGHAAALDCFQVCAVQAGRVVGKEIEHSDSIASLSWKTIGVWPCPKIPKETLYTHGRHVYGTDFTVLHGQIPAMHNANHTNTDTTGADNEQHWQVVRYPRLKGR